MIEHDKYLLDLKFTRDVPFSDILHRTLKKPSGLHCLHNGANPTHMSPQTIVPW